MKKNMMMALFAGLLMTACTKEEVNQFIEQQQPVVTEYSIAHLTGRWEAFKKDELTNIGIPVNPPNRDTLVINANKTYTWKATWGTQQGTIKVLANNRFELAPNGGSAGTYKYTLSGQELKLELLFGNLYLRKF